MSETITITATLEHKLKADEEIKVYYKDNICACLVVQAMREHFPNDEIECGMTYALVGEDEYKLDETGTNLVNSYDDEQDPATYLPATFTITREEY